MPQRRVHAEGTYAHFVTFSCYKRRRFLDADHGKRIVIGSLGNQLRKHNGICVGFTVMPDHVHAIVWFYEEQRISAFMDKWKEVSSKQLKQLYEQHIRGYFNTDTQSDPIWQDRYYGFNINSDSKLREKLEYMHNNPVRAGLVQDPCAWPWSSAQFWLQGKSVGLPISWIPG